MSTLSWVPRLNVTVPVTVTPTISATSYSANAQVGGILTLPNVIRIDSQLGYGTANLTDVLILDKASQSAAFNIYFFLSSPTLVSTNTQAFQMSDAEMIANCIGSISVGGTYKTAAANAQSEDLNINKRVYTTSGSSIYAVLQTTSTPTYTSTSDLTLRFFFDID